MESIDLVWKGPYRWPGLDLENDEKRLEQTTIGRKCGIYLWTVEYCEGYLIYAAGITRRPFVKRFREHTRSYLAGIFTIFDVIALKKGERKKIWPGFWFSKKGYAEKQDEFNRRADEIRLATYGLLENYRVFLATLDPVPRLFERIEASIMNNLYHAVGVASEIPDRGMQLSPRWDSEQPIIIRNIAPVFFHGLPDEFEV